jgi:hypothetical protein
MLSLESELAAIVLRVLPSLRWKFTEALRNMIASAERSLDALADRDQLQLLTAPEPEGKHHISSLLIAKSASNSASHIKDADLESLRTVDPRPRRARADSDITVVEEVPRTSGSFDRHWEPVQPHAHHSHPHGLVLSMSNLVEEPEPMTPADLRAAARREF